MSHVFEKKLMSGVSLCNLMLSYVILFNRNDTISKLTNFMACIILSIREFYRFFKLFWSNLVSIWLRNSNYIVFKSDFTAQC